MADSHAVASEYRSGLAWRACAEDLMVFTGIGLASGLATSLILVRQPNSFFRGTFVGTGIGIGIGRAWDKCNSRFGVVEVSGGDAAQ